MFLTKQEKRFINALLLCLKQGINPSTKFVLKKAGLKDKSIYRDLKKKGVCKRIEIDAFSFKWEVNYDALH